MAQAGFVTGIIGTCISGLVILFMILCIVIVAVEYDGQAIDSSAGDNVYTCTDESEIVFHDGDFFWYQEAGERDDNYIYGTYEIYYKEEEEEYFYNELSEHGFTKSELEDYYERNEGSELYNESNFCVMILHNEGACIDGAEEEYMHDTPYFGFYKDGYYEAVNLNTYNYAYFTKQE